MNYPSTVLADGPLFYWKLDEDIPSTNAQVQLVDSSGNGRPSTFDQRSRPTDRQPSVVTPFSDPTGFSMEFFFTYWRRDGVELPVGAGAWSVEWWTSRADAGEGAMWAIHGGDTTAGSYVQCGFDDSGHTGAGGYPAGLHLLSSPATPLVSATTMVGSPLGIPQVRHWVATYDGTTLRIYCNGVEEDSAVVTLAISASGTRSFRLGRIYQTNSFNVGSLVGTFLDEVAVYGYALSPTQVAVHYETGTWDPTVIAEVAASGYVWSVDFYVETLRDDYGAFLYWRLDDPGGDVLDSSTYGGSLDGTVAGSATRAVTGATPDANPAIELLGGTVSRSIDFFSDPGPGEGWGFSVSCLFKTAHTGTTRLWDWGGIAWVDLVDGQVEVWSSNGVDATQIAQIGSTAVNDDGWHQLVVTHDGVTEGPTLSAYLDGDTPVASGLGPANADLPDGIYTFALGAFQGTVDELGLFDYPLLQEEAGFFWEVLGGVPAPAGTIAVTADALVEAPAATPVYAYRGGQVVLGLARDGEFSLQRGGRSAVRPGSAYARSVLGDALVRDPSVGLQATGLVLGPGVKELGADGLVVAPTLVYGDGLVAATNTRLFPRRATPTGRLSPVVP